MKSFQDQVAIVTGAGQGIGLEICKQLVGGGAKVVLNDIDDDLTAKAAAGITNDQNICLPMVGDASNIGFIQRMRSVQLPCSILRAPELLRMTATP